MKKALRFQHLNPKIISATISRMADKWHPSSRTYFECKKKKDSLPLSVRSWKCACGAFHDRDENAAKNLRFEAVEQYRLYLLEKKALS